MAEKFDPYHAWLGIPPEEQPPNHYRLLGVPPFEESSEVIEAAADQRTGNLHAFRKGGHAGLALKLLNEVSVAKVCLLNANRKAAYDKGLRERLEAETKPQDDDLELVPLDDEPPRRTGGRKKPRPAPSAAEAPLQMVEPTPPAPPAQKPPKPPPAPPPAPDAAGSLLEEELPPSAGVAAGTGPLDGLLGEANLTAAAGGSLLDVAPKPKGLRRLFARPKRIGKKTNVWDSPLLLIGGGALLTLLILLSVLIWVLERGTGDQALQRADEDYRAGKYAQAIHKYDLYLKKFPNHTSVSLARVHRGLAKLRQKTQKGTRDWPAALDKAQEVLEEIRPQTEFKQAHADLSVMLLAIADGLAAMARQTPDRELIAQTEEALELLRMNVPKSLRRADKMADIEASLALTERIITRDDELGKAIHAMRKAIDDGNPQRAYTIRKTLLRHYSTLADDSQLKEVLREVSLAQRDAVKWVEARHPGSAEEPATPVLSTVALAQRTTATKVKGVDGHVVFATAAGAAYGLDAATGEVLWRRFLGLASNGQGIGFPPKAISPEPGADVLLVDPRRNELLRVKAASGNLVWRHATREGERFDAQPVIAFNRILLATRSGRLVVIDSVTGNSSGYFQLPQSLHVAPAVDTRQSLIFQPADHSNLFVLSLGSGLGVPPEKGECKRVVYLGHELRSIAAAPVVVSRFLILAVNDRVRDSSLRVLSIDQGDEGLAVKPVQRLRLTGHVDTTPLVTGRRVLVTTDQGTVCVFEISGSDEKKPLRLVAQTTAGSPENVIRFPLMQSGQCWIAGVQLTRYEIQAARSQLVPKWVVDQDGVFQQPLVTLGPAIFHVRRKVGMPGMVVSAVDREQGSRFWETHLAVPLPTEPMVAANNRSLTAVTSLGGLFQLSDTSIHGKVVVDQPAAAVNFPRSTLRPLTTATWLPGGALAMTAGEGSRQIAVFDPRRSPKAFQWIELPDALSCRPISFAGGLLVPSKIGLVFLLDPRTGGKLYEPFQPALMTGVELAWQAPALAAQYGAVLADGRTMLYRLAVQDQPKPGLAAVDKVELSEPIVSPVAVLGDKVFAVDAAGALSVFTLPKLTRNEGPESIVTGQLLGGRCVWGPGRIASDNHVMLATDDELFCLDQTGLRWRTGLPYGRLAGPPQKNGAHYILASTGGMIWRVDGASGQELGKIDLGRPLGTGPVIMPNGPLGNDLLLGGHDGTLYRIKQPPAQ